MALDKKKTGFGFDMEEKFKKVEKPVGQVEGNAYTDTDTDTHTYTDAYTDVLMKEPKSKRLYLLAKPSVHKKLDDYAKAHGDSFNNLVHTLMEDFIKKNNL